MSLIWSRRAFLTLVATGATGTLALRALPEVKNVVDLATRRELRSMRIQDLSAESLGSDPGWFRIMRGQNCLLELPMSPGSLLRWWTPPGFELVSTPAHPIWNGSDAHIKLQTLIFRYDGKSYAMTGRGVFCLDTETHGFPPKRLLDPMKGHD